MKEGNVFEWTVETSDGDFEGCSLKSVLYDVLEYYGNNKNAVLNILDAYAYSQDEEFFRPSKKKIERIRIGIDERVLEWRNEV